jgi:hypothetical protein
VTQEERRALIAQYRDGVHAVESAVSGASDRELDARPAAEKWSSREIVHHLADSEMTAAVRVRRILAEEQPVIHGYDQEEFARRLHYDRPIASSLQALRFAVASTADLLECLGPAEWNRRGTHSEHGEYTMEKWLTIYAGHARKHAEQIRHARASVAH